MRQVDLIQQAHLHELLDRNHQGVAGICIGRGVRGPVLFFRRHKREDLSTEVRVSLDAETRGPHLLPPPRPNSAFRRGEEKDACAGRVQGMQADDTGFRMFPAGQEQRPPAREGCPPTTHPHKQEHTCHIVIPEEATQSTKAKASFPISPVP